MALEKSSKTSTPQTKTRKQGAPIIAQSPAVIAGGKEFVILPGPVATIPARKSKKDKS